jgi:hypothetical protein
LLSRLEDILIRRLVRKEALIMTRKWSRIRERLLLRLPKRRRMLLVRCIVVLRLECLGLLCFFVNASPENNDSASMSSDNGEDDEDDDPDEFDDPSDFGDSMEEDGQEQVCVVLF